MNLKAALRDRLMTLDWIGEETRKRALYKLQKMRVKIGYPDHWRDYTKLAVDSPYYVVNVEEANVFDYNRDIAKLHKPVDRSEWGMTPPTVNAYYSPSGNEIVFPAGILQPPFFDPKADDASNYGGIGAVIGHEMTHGFDDQGRQFDANGNLKDWWTDADKKNFQARADQVADQFDNFVTVDGLHVNGHLTLGEDIADLGGLKLAYLAFEKSQIGHPKAKLIGGYTPEQRFFSGVCPDLASERPPRSPAPEPCDRPARPQQVPRAWSDFQPAGVCSSVPLPGRRRAESRPRDDLVACFSFNVGAGLAPARLFLPAFFLPCLGWIERRARVRLRGQ